MKTYVRDIYNFLDSIAPFKTAMDFDNCGLLVGNMSESINKVLLSLDITREIVGEAESIGANLIISHHPVIFNPLKKLLSDCVPYMLAKKGIGAICAHTNLDMADGCGVNACLAKAIGLKNTQPLSVYSEDFYNKIIVFVPEGYEDKVMNTMCDNGAGKLGSYSGCGFLSSGEGRFSPGDSSNPFIGNAGEKVKTKEIRLEMIVPQSKTYTVVNAMKEVHPYELPAYDIIENKAVSKKIACGLIGVPVDPISSRELAQIVKESLGCSGLKYTQIDKKINKIAVCSGAGGDYLDFAIEKGADAFITGEIKHHMILKANDSGIMLVDAGHFKTEDIVFDNLIKLLSKKFQTVQFYKTKLFTDNIKYL